jgi:NRAMP (natural resistance-associated macrophage protein)-like metal ion transporter
MQKKDLLEEIAETPSIILEETIRSAKRIEKTLEKKTVVQLSKKYLKGLGPGLISGAADDDPSGIATYSQAGARYGFGFLWLSVWTLPLMATIQEMCGRIAMVTGEGLATNIKKTFSKKMLYTCSILLVLANAINIGANLGAMAAATRLIFPGIGFTFLVISIGIFCLVLQIFSSYKTYSKYLKWLAFSLFSYIATGLIIKMDWSVVLSSAFIPNISFTKDYILMTTAILGTTISPYLFFWQTSQEVEEEILKGRTSIIKRRGAEKKELKEMRTDVWSGMTLSNLVMFFIISVCGVTLYAHGITNIETAAEAAEALKPLAGPGAYLLFALGIIGTGMLSIPVLAGSAAYAVAESFKWKEGLYRKLKQARAFYGVIIISIIIGILINFIGISPMKALLYTAIANGIIAPIILITIVHISSNKKIMGEYRNSPLKNFIGWFTTIAMGFCSIATIWYLIF